MKRIFANTLSLALLLSILTACGFNEAHDDVATKLVDEYIAAVHAKNYDKALSLVSDEFLAQRGGRDQWIAYFKEVDAKLGDVTKVKLKRTLSDARLSAHFYMYEYTNTYENGFAKELITIVQKINTDDPLKIGGHKYESSKL